MYRFPNRVRNLVCARDVGTCATIRWKKNVTRLRAAEVTGCRPRYRFRMSGRGAPRPVLIWIPNRRGRAGAVWSRRMHADLANNQIHCPNEI